MKKLLNYIFLATAVVCIGFAAIFIRLAGAPGIVSAFYRMAIAVVLFSPIAVYELIRQRHNLKIRGILLALLGGTFFGFDMCLWSTGIMISGATMPTLLANMAPLWVGIGSIILFREKQKTLFWIGLFFALLGAILVFQNDFTNENINGKGSLFGFIAAMFYGAFFFTAQEGRKFVNTAIYFWFSTLGSCVVLILFVIINGYPLTGYSHQTYLYFLGLGIGVQLIGWMLVNHVQGYMSASVVAPTLLGQPIVTAILAGFLIQDEKLGYWHLIGGIVVLAGIYMVHYGKIKK